MPLPSAIVTPQGDGVRLPWRGLALVLVSTALLVAMILGVAATLVRMEHEQSAEAGRELLERFVKGTEGNVNRALLGIDLMLAGCSDGLVGARAGDGAPDLGVLQRSMRSSVQQSLLARDLAIFDGEGRLLTNLMPGNTRVDPAAPEAFVAEVLAQRYPTLGFSAPGLAPVSAEPVIYLGRQLRLPEGRRLAAVAQVNLTLLAAILGQSADLTALRVTLERRDGQVLVSAPLIDAADKVSAVTPLRPSHVDGVAHEVPAQGDGSTTWVAARPTTYADLLIAASLPQAQMQREWLDYRRNVWGVALGMVALVLALGALTWAYLLQQARSRQAVSAAKRFLDQALDSMDEGFAVWDAQGRMLAMNQRYLEMFPWLQGVAQAGMGLDELLVASAPHLLPDATEQERRAWVDSRKALQVGGTMPFEHHLPGGRIVSTQLRPTPEGGTVGQYRDITEARATELALRQAHDEAEAANRAKSAFLAVMSHEIRTPMNGVIGMAEVLALTPLDGDQARSVRTIRESGFFLLKLIDDILDFSKIEADQLELERAVVPLHELAASACNALVPIASSKGVAIEVDIRPGVPTHVWGDATRLRQILTNLLGNAIKFSAGRPGMAGHVHASLSLQTDRAPRLPSAPGVGTGAQTAPADGLGAPAARPVVCLAVADNGVGIDVDAMTKLYTPFVQADVSTTRKFGGTGLGLAICHRLVALMGGVIEVRSTLGQGAEFRVYLPLEPAPAPMQAARPASALDAAPPALRAKRLLVAEDDVINQMVIARQLQVLGYAADVATDGHEALRMWRERSAGAEPYAGLLTDLHMPKMDGYELGQSIRAEEQRLALARRMPILCLTANAIRGESERALAVGMDAYLTKPLEIHLLKAALERWLGPAPHAHALRLEARPETA